MRTDIVPSPYGKVPIISKKPRINEHIETAIVLAGEAHKAYNTFKEWRRRRFAYTVVISERDGLYQDVHNWLLSVLPHEKHRNIVVASDKKNRAYAEDEMATAEAVAPKPQPLSIRFNDKTSRHIAIEGFKVEVSLHVPETSDKSEKYFERFQVHNEISFTTFSYEGQQAVIRQLEKLNQARATTRKAVLKMTTQWGDWRTRSDLPPRTMDSVSLPKEQKDRIINDLGTFLESEDRYNRLAIPWHRGYMFYGPPGTGKTSLVKALANHFNLDLWYISISDLNAESNLLSLVGGVGPRSMLLLEDIDTIKITHDRDSSDSGKISTGSLLNVLDGVATPHGLITVMTTNRFDILDPALTRAGRMDLIEELGYPSKSTVREMFEHFFGETTPLAGIKEDEFADKSVSTSQIAEVFKRHMDDPKLAVKSLKELIKT